MKRFFESAFVVFAIFAVSSFSYSQTPQPVTGDTPKVSSVDVEQIETVEVQPVVSGIPAASVTLGGRFSKDNNTGFVDVLAPFAGNQTGFFFLDPRISISEGPVNEQNVGLGARKLVMDEKLIVGGNIFYDSRETQHRNRFDQIGVGAELLTEWVDARFNYYWPQDDEKEISSYQTQEVETNVTTEWYTPYFDTSTVEQRGKQTTTTKVTNRYFYQYEKPLEGLDFEIGVKIPGLDKWMETRVFGGYYFYDNDYGKDIKGFKGRLELRALPALIFDAEIYENKDLKGTDYYLGARLNVPFDFGNLFSGRNPFEGAADRFKKGSSRTMRDRMTEMVIRDLDIISDQSDYMEKTSQTSTDISETTSSVGQTLRSDIVYVDQDYKGKSDGSLNHPCKSISKGVKKAHGNKYVYVFKSNKDYKENVVLEKGVKLWGSGDVTFGCESGKKPVIDGQGNGHAVTLANNTEVSGFKITNSGLISSTGGVSIARSKIIAGVYGENIKRFALRDNRIAGNEYGVCIINSNINSFDGLIDGCVIRNNDWGVTVFSENFKESGGGAVIRSLKKEETEPSNIKSYYADNFNLLISNSNISDNESSGVYVEVFNSNNISLVFENSSFRNNGDEGIELFGINTGASVFSGADVSVADFQENPDDFFGDSFTMVVSGCSFERNKDEGIDLETYNFSNSKLMLVDSVFNSNGDEGVFWGNAAFAKTGIQGPDFPVDMVVDSNIDLVVSGCEFNGNVRGLLFVSEGSSKVSSAIADSFFNSNEKQGAIFSVRGPKIQQGGSHASGSYQVSLAGTFNLDVYNSEFNENGDGTGLLVEALMIRKADISLKNVIASSNEILKITGDIQAQKVLGDGGVAVVALTEKTNMSVDGLTAKNNSSNGLTVYDDIGKFNADIKNSNLSSNGETGMYLEIFGGEARVFAENNTVFNNKNTGVVMGGVEGSILDFGGGKLGSSGRNSIYGNGKMDFENTGFSKVKAQNNWWGRTNPKDSQFSGNVDHSNPLQEKPAQQI